LLKLTESYSASQHQKPLKQRTSPCAALSPTKRDADEIPGATTGNITIYYQAAQGKVQMFNIYGDGATAVGKDGWTGQAHGISGSQHRLLVRNQQQSKE